MENIVPDNWYEKFFSGINCEMWERAIPEIWTEKEVSFLIEVLKIKKGNNILDIPCGFGRIAVPLAIKKFKLSCVDISKKYIQDLSKRVKKENLPVRIMEGDILSVKLTGRFDGAFCLGNSFGYFDFKGMKKFVKKVAKCLKPRSRFIINSGMVAESILPKIPAEKTYVLGDLTMQINNEYVASESFMVSHLKYTQNGHVEQHSYKHYVFTIGEIKRLLESYDFKTIALYNGVEKETYKLGDQQLYLVAEKI